MSTPLKLEPYSHEVVRRYLEGESPTEIGVAYNAGHKAVLNVLKSRNVKLRTRSESAVLARKRRDPPRSKEERRSYKKSYQAKYMKTYYAHNKNALKVYQKQYRATHFDELRAYGREYNRTNRSSLAKRKREWRRNNPDKHKAIKARRRALEGAPITEVNWQLVLAQFEGKCAYCGEAPEKLTQDHVIPLSKGGSHALENIVPACLSCNASKGAKIVVTPRARKWG